MTKTVARTGWRKTLAALAPAIALLAGVFATGTDADAQSRICRQLESQLAGASSGGGSSSQARRYERAIDQQRAQLAKGERQYRRAGCGGGLFWRDSGGRGCDSLDRSLDRMERNLAQLERARARMGGERGGSRRDRARILAALDANGCRAAPRERELPKAAGRQGGSLFEQLFGGGNRRAERPPEREFQEYDRSARVRTIIPRGGSVQTIDPSPGSGGNYRTLCVRTCDGYYWPISYSSSSMDFQRDEQNCQTMCPGTEVKLYSHRVPDEESENMVDSNGAAYTDLTTAFKYKDASFTKPEGCTCASRKKNFSVIAGGSTNGSVPMSVPTEPAATEAVALPFPRPDAGADPETLANREGSFDSDDMRRLSRAKPGDAGETASVERRVRVVGPAYLPDQEEAAGLQVPGPTSVQ